MRFLFVDRILQITDGTQIRGIKHVTPDDYYRCPSACGTHDVFIPSLMGETLGQLAAWYVMREYQFARRPVAGVVARSCVHRPVAVGETMLLHAVIDSLDDEAVLYHGTIHVGEELVFTLEGALGPLLPMENFIDPDEARQQWQSINRPGEWMPLQVLAPWTPQSALTSRAACAPMTFDHILSDEPGVRLCAQKLVSFSASYFPDHFPRQAVLPLTVLLECQTNLVMAWFERQGLAYQPLALQKIKMNAFVHPGDVLTCTVVVKQKTDLTCVVSCRCEVDGRRVCVSEIVFNKGQHEQ